VLRAERFQRPDHLPLEFLVHDSLVIRGGHELAELLRQYDYDTEPVNLQIEADGRNLDPSYHAEQTDNWGVVWSGSTEGHPGQPKAYPFCRKLSYVPLRAAYSFYLDWRYFDQYR